MKKLTANAIKEYQKRAMKLTTIGEWKALGRELRDAYGLTYMDAIDILNKKNVLVILVRYEKAWNRRAGDDT